MDGEKLNLLFESFSDITSLVRSGGGMEELYTRVLDCSCKLLHPNCAMLLLVQDDCLQKYTYSSDGEDGPLTVTRLQCTDALIEWLQHRGQAFARSEGEWPDALRSALPERFAGSIACAPLIAQESQIGLLVALRDGSPTGFSPADLQLLTVLANQTAIAVENRTLYDRLMREAITDGLTGVHNYRALMNALRMELRRARRYEQVFTFIMADVDHLKTYNERFGHIAGSQVLAQIARKLANNCRATDIVGKYGGDEFALILPQTGREGACEVSDRMRKAIASHGFKHVRPGDVTCSFGIAVYPEDATDVGGLILQADRILFNAKRAGKNRVLTTQDDAPAVNAATNSSPKAQTSPRGEEPEPTHS